MNKLSLLVVLVALTMLAGIAQAQRPAPNWGGDAPAPAGTAGGSPFGAKPAPTPAPSAVKPPSTPQTVATASCYSFRARGGSQHQIACFATEAACNGSKADYQRKNPAMEVMGCAPAIHCFTYNPGGASSSCYLSAADCTRARSDFASRSGPNVGACVANATAGTPKVQVATSTPPPPPPGAGTPVQPAPVAFGTPPPPPPVSAQASSTPAPIPPALMFDFAWTPRGLKELYNYEDAPQTTGGCLDASKWATWNGERVAEYHWSIEGITQMQSRSGNKADYAGANYKKEESGSRVCRDFAEGAYLVTLTLVTASGKKSHSHMQAVVVKDVLIAGMGDSYSSGEGNPDTKISYNLNNALLPRQPVVETKIASFNYGSPVWADSNTQPAPLSGTDWESDDLGMTKKWREHRFHSRCHRSKAAATPLLVRKIAAQYPHLSVTMVFVSCSGATVDQGLINGYTGVEFPGKRDLLWPQIDDVNAHVKGRSVDAVTLSIGGNDVGFSTIVSDLVVNGRNQSALRDYKVNVDNTGDILLENLVNRLPDKYGKVKNKMEGMRAFDRAKIFATEYPDILSITRTNGQVSYANVLMKDIFKDDVFWAAAGAGAYAVALFATPLAIAAAEAGGIGIAATGNYSFDGISATEASWAVQSVLQPLNQKLKSIVQSAPYKDKNWVLVDGIEADFRGHGYCSRFDDGCDPSKSWVRTAYDSAHFQGPPSDFEFPGGGFTSVSGSECLPCKKATKGLVHPNELGHQAIANRLHQQVSANLFSDVAVAINGPAQADANAEVPISVSVSNRGPSVATDVLFSMFVPQGFTITGYTWNGATFATGMTQEAVKIGALDRNQRVDLIVKVRAPNLLSACATAAQPHNLNAIASSFSPDIAPANNGASLVLNVVPKVVGGCSGAAAAREGVVPAVTPVNPTRR